MDRRLIRHVFFGVILVLAVVGVVSLVGASGRGKADSRSASLGAESQDGSAAVQDDSAVPRGDQPLPDCVPVSDAGGTRTVGCVNRDDLRPPNGDPPAEQLTVYDGQGQQVGKLVAGNVLYVENALLPELPKIIQCHEDLNSHLASNGPALSSSCYELLKLQGIPTVTLDAPAGSLSSTPPGGSLGNNPPR